MVYKDVGLENLGKGPCCVVVYKNREYAAAKNPMIPIGISMTVALDKTEVNRIISLSKFNDVGAAIFPAANKNHQNLIAGKYIKRPLVKNSLRVFVAS